MPVGSIGSDNPGVAASIESQQSNLNAAIEAYRTYCDAATAYRDACGRLTKDELRELNEHEEGAARVRVTQAMKERKP